MNKQFAEQKWTRTRDFSVVKCFAETGALIEKLDKNLIDS